VGSITGMGYDPNCTFLEFYDSMIVFFFRASPNNAEFVCSSHSDSKFADLNTLDYRHRHLCIKQELTHVTQDDTVHCYSPSDRIPSQ